MTQISVPLAGPDPSYINRVARFLAHEQITCLSACPPADCIVLCVSAIFHCVDTLFSALKARPNLTKTLVICGGVGHSTPFLYDAVAKDSKYQHLAEEIRGLPEARILYMIFQRYYDGAAIIDAGCKVLVEDKSTNCGANAIETRRILELEGDPIPKSIVVVQDPTMSRRTIASFKKAFHSSQPVPEFFSCPTFVPEIQKMGENVVFSTEGVAAKGLWSPERFYALIMGEIPRLRDDQNGYGPRGKGFIVHVDIPEDVEEALEEMRTAFTAENPTQIFQRLGIDSKGIVARY